MLMVIAMAAAITVDTLSGFAVSYSTPYMLDAMGNNIGYVFLGFAVAALFWVAFFMPETKGTYSTRHHIGDEGWLIGIGRTLDELDECFEQGLWAWQFEKYETTGAASRFAHVNQERLEGKGGDLTMEDVTRVSSCPTHRVWYELYRG